MPALESLSTSFPDYFCARPGLARQRTDVTTWDNPPIAPHPNIDFKQPVLFLRVVVRVEP
jgi:hypothetical protein